MFSTCPFSHLCPSWFSSCTLPFLPKLKAQMPLRGLPGPDSWEEDPLLCSGPAKHSHLSPWFYLFIWLHWVLFVVCGIFSGSMQTLSCGMWDPLPYQGSNPCPLHWECRLLATGPPRKFFSPGIYFPASCSHSLYLLLTCPGCGVSCLPKWMLAKAYQSG